MELYFKKYRIFLKHSFGISRSKNTWYDVLFIYLKEDELVGRGEAAPSIRYNESIKLIENILSKGINLPKNNSDYLSIWSFIYPQLMGIKSLEAAFSMALLDFFSQKKQQTVYEFLKIKYIKSHKTSFTIALGHINEIEQKIKESLPYDILKVKLGTPNDDRSIIREIRKYTDKKIRVDANEGWSLDKAISLCKWLYDYNIELIEQPFPANQLYNTLKLKENSPLDIYADENCCSLQDIHKIHSAFDGVNIKLMKCGSITEGLKIIRLAKKYDLKVMLGCMIESSIGITAAAQLAGEVDLIDLDGNLLIKNDPYIGIEIINGFLSLNGKSGLGLNLKEPVNGLY